MNIPVNHLVSRNGKYYFRCRLPQNGYSALSPAEIKISLRTSDQKIAISACKLLTDRLNSLVKTGAVRTMTLNEIRRILVEEYATGYIEDYARQLADYGPICPKTRKQGLAGALNIMAHYEQELNSGNPTGKQCAETTLRDVPHTGSDINLMAQEWTLMQIFLARVQYDRIAGKRFPTEYSQTLYDEIMSGNYRTAEEIREAETVLTLGELVRRYLAEKNDSWGASMRGLAKAALDVLLEYFDAETDVKAVKHQNLLDFRDNVLLKLPPGRNTNPKYQGIPLTELLAKHKGETLTRKTVNLRMAQIRGFFIWCFKHEYISRNPASDLQLTLGHKASTERLPYSKEELQTIFENLREDRLRNWRSYKLWIPLIALYSGARMNEICQLQVDNVFTVGGIPCFEITDEGDETASVKTESSKRVVPVHPVLLQLGFLNYVLERRKEKRSRTKEVPRLWPMLKYKEGHGYAHDFSKSYRNFNKRYVTQDSKKVFHSFRHNFTDNLKQQGLQESMIAELVGHSVKSMTFSRYGKEFNPAILRENMLKLDYGIDIFGILGKTPLEDEMIAGQVEQLPKR